MDRTEPEGEALRGVPGLSHRRRRVSLSLVLSLAAVLRVYRLGEQSLWGDEVRSILRSQMILAQGFGSGIFDAHGPLFFYTLLPFVSFSVNEWIVRLPSALFGVALALLAYFLGRELLGQDHALLASVVTACSPFSIYYSQEVRYIGVFVLLCGLSMFWMIRYLEAGSLGSLIAYTLATLLSLFSFVGGLFVVLGQNVWFAFAARRRSRTARWVSSQVLIFAVFLPWMVHAFHFDIRPFGKPSPDRVAVGSLKAGHHRSLKPIHLAYALYVLSVGFSLGPSNRDLHEDSSFAAVWADASTVAPAALVFGALLVTGVFHSLSLSKEKAGLILSCLVFPLLGAYLVATVTRIPLNPRYSAAALPAHILFLTAGVAWWWRRGRPGALVLLLGAGLLTLSLANNYHNPRYAREDNRGAAALIARHRQAHEPLIVGVPTHAFAFYYAAPFTEWERATVEKMGSTSDAPPKVPAERLWVAASRTWEDPGFAALLKELQRCFPLEDHFDLAGYQILSFRTASGETAGACAVRIES